MNFTDEQLKAIRNMGLEINAETLESLETLGAALAQSFQALAEAIVAALKPAMDRLAEIITQIVEMPPRQRYKAVKQIGVENYPVFFQRNRVYHCRNNC